MRQTELRQAYIQLCKKYKPNLMITLATNQAWPSAKMTQLIGEFARRIDFLALGRKCFKKPIAMRADGIFFIEKPNANVHAHGLVHVPYDVVGAIGTWEALCPSGSIDVQPIKSFSAARYCTKEFELRSHSADQIVLLSDFMSVKSLCG